MTERANWLRVLEREAEVEQCDLFITVRKSNELHTSGDYEEVIQFEPPPASHMLADSNTSRLYEDMNRSVTERTITLAFCIFSIFISAGWA